MWLTAFSMIHFLIYHHLFVDKNDILKAQIESQLQPYFYREYAKKSSQLDGEIASKMSDEDFKSFGALKLNYSSKAQFIYDNRTRDGILNKSREIFGTNS